MFFNLKREEENDNMEMLMDVKESVTMIVQNLLNNISFYTEKIEKLEKENNQLKQFIGELEEIVSNDRDSLLFEMESYLSRNSETLEDYET
jgi:prefoldin subunit 5